jgi:hypothetical protein
MLFKTRRRSYIREALFFLAIARVALWFIPANKILTWTARAPRRVCRFSGFEVDWISWAIESEEVDHWLHSVCLPRAIAAQLMLRRRGIHSRSCLGVRHHDRKLIAHAWVEVGARVMVGEREYRRFTKVAEFGAATDISASSKV